MRIRGLLTLILFSISLSQAALAAEASPSLAPVIEHMRTRIRLTTKSIQMYSWSQASNLANDPEAFKKLSSQAQIFWNNYGQPNRKYYEYGAGYYWATDPYSSIQFGAGRSPTWLLQNLTLPTGLRVLDLRHSENSDPLPGPVLKILREFKCPEETTLEELFSGGGDTLDPDCQALTRAVFRDILKIDGFFYHYRGAPFVACTFPESENPRMAFIMTNSSWMKADQLKLYNQETKTSKSERILIQSVINKASDRESDFTSEWMKYITLKPNEVNPRIFCDDDRCRLKTNDKEVEFALPEGSETLTTRSAPATFIARKAQGKLAPQRARNLMLWPDLEGEPAVPTNAWLKENILGCDGEIPLNRSQP